MTSNTTGTTSDEACVCDSPTSTCPGVVTGTITNADDGLRLGEVEVAGNQGARTTQTDSSGEYELEVDR
ncbi:MAG: hypothetical protein AAFS10_09025, partial [Myxococcota bacterium]